MFGDYRTGQRQMNKELYYPIFYLMERQTRKRKKKYASPYYPVAGLRDDLNGYRPYRGGNEECKNEVEETSDGSAAREVDAEILALFARACEGEPRAIKEAYFYFADLYRKYPQNPLITGYYLHCQSMASSQ
ncbi:hypothetical protein GTO89_00520 [Heliobacterium gestii]|uniref:Uncharacterized protein n=1 Tax=Heliomicrobium gestii TaxID=2699 RepID=A0A845LF95_HELGE|nr:hypothetical protein [Heliomicrobium gestii]MBM7865251.1 hypothetical protein [Heliomicrobium gestii]MZP41516.1 hypothetical protein [Heliomicrobium gestii]